MREFLSDNDVPFDDRNIRHNEEARTELAERSADIVVPQLSDEDYKDRPRIREADLRRHLLAQSNVEDKLLEADNTPDPRFMMTPASLEKQGIKDFQLYYALNTIKRLSSTATIASAATPKKLR